MTYDEALKQVQTNKDNLIGIVLDYSTMLVLSYEDGLAYLKALKNAEVIEYFYDNSKCMVMPITDEKFRVSPFSAQKYQDIKVAQLMGITYKELLESKNI